MNSIRTHIFVFCFVAALIISWWYWEIKSSGCLDLSGIEILFAAFWDLGLGYGQVIAICSGYLLKFVFN